MSQMPLRRVMNFQIGERTAHLIGKFAQMRSAARDLPKTQVLPILHGARP
jgi:hypothetical protein